jgi:hypothetical protein
MRVDDIGHGHTHKRIKVPACRGSVMIGFARGPGPSISAPGARGSGQQLLEVQVQAKAFRALHKNVIPLLIRIPRQVGGSSAQFVGISALGPVRIGLRVARARERCPKIGRIIGPMWGSRFCPV